MLPVKISDSYNDYFKERKNPQISLNRLLIAAEKKQYLSDEQCSKIINNYYCLFAKKILDYEKTSATEEEMELEIITFRENMFSNYLYVLETYLSALEPFEALQLIVQEVPAKVLKKANHYFGVKLVVLREKIKQLTMHKEIAAIIPAYKILMRSIWRYYNHLRKIKDGNAMFSMYDRLERWLYPVSPNEEAIESFKDLETIVDNLIMEESILKHFEIKNVSRMVKENYLSDSYVVNLSQIATYAYAIASLFKENPENLDVLGISVEDLDGINNQTVWEAIKNGKIRFSSEELAYIKKWFFQADEFL